MGKKSWFVLNFEPNPLMKYGTNGAKTFYAVLYGHRLSQSTECSEIAAKKRDLHHLNKTCTLK
jgi:hypothetical protein